MNRYIMLRRLRWPAILMLVGVVALLDEMNVIDHFWRLFIPLLLILLGVMMLAERAMLAADGGFPPYPDPSYGGAPYAGAGDPLSAAQASGTSGATSTAIVPARTTDEEMPSGGER
jgi:hypothetical protein